MLAHARQLVGVDEVARLHRLLNVELVPVRHSVALLCSDEGGLLELQLPAVCFFAEKKSDAFLSIRGSFRRGKITEVITGITGITWNMIIFIFYFFMFYFCCVDTLSRMSLTQWRTCTSRGRIGAREVP